MLVSQALWCHQQVKAENVFTDKTSNSKMIGFLGSIHTLYSIAPVIDMPHWILFFRYFSLLHEQTWLQTSDVFCISPVDVSALKSKWSLHNLVAFDWNIIYSTGHPVGDAIQPHSFRLCEISAFLYFDILKKQKTWIIQTNCHPAVMWRFWLYSININTMISFQEPLMKMLLHYISVVKGYGNQKGASWHIH